MDNKEVKRITGQSVKIRAPSHWKMKDMNGRHDVYNLPKLNRD